MFNKRRNHATIYGSSGSTKYTQDGKRYNAAFKYLGKVGEDDITTSSGDIIGAPGPLETQVSTIGMGKEELIVLATSHGLHANGRMSEQTLRNKISDYNANIPSTDTRPTARMQRSR